MNNHQKFNPTKEQFRSTQVARALITKAYRGEFPGKAPIGYVNDTQTKQVVPDSKSWSVIKEALEKYATGSFIIGWMAQFLNDELSSIQQGKCKPLTKTQVAAILQNPFYLANLLFVAKHTAASTNQ